MSGETTVSQATGIVNSSIIEAGLLRYQIDNPVSVDKVRADKIPNGTKTVGVPIPTKSSSTAALTDGTAMAQAVMAFSNTTITAQEVGILRLLTKMASRTNILGEDGLYEFALEDGTRLCLEKFDVDIQANWPNASSSFGTSQQPMTIPDITNAISQLAINKANGPYVAILSGQQMRDLRAAIATTTATAFVQKNNALLDVTGNDGYAGTFMGVDVWVNNAQASSGGNKTGVVMVDGAMNKAFAPVTVGYLWMPEAVELSQPQYPGQQVAMTMSYGSAETVDGYYIGLATTST